VGPNDNILVILNKFKSLGKGPLLYWGEGNKGFRISEVTTTWRKQSTLSFSSVEKWKAY
jgi:hypothetical protein